MPFSTGRFGLSWLEDDMTGFTLPAAAFLAGLVRRDFD
jgi:hypothetical protein